MPNTEALKGGTEFIESKNKGNRTIVIDAVKKVEGKGC